MLHKLQNYDSDLIFQGIGKYNFKINVHAKNNRKMYKFYYSATKRERKKTRTSISIFYFFNWDSTPCKAEQPLRGMELQEKKHKKDYRIQKICLERTYS